MSAVPGAENQLVRHERMEVNTLAEAYMQDKAKVEKELGSVIEMLHHVAAVVKCSCPELVVFMWKTCPELVVFMWKINLDSRLTRCSRYTEIKVPSAEKEVLFKGITSQGASRLQTLTGHSRFGEGQNKCTLLIEAVE